ncbi:MAG: 2-C-methyl-D-erythritol 4-phosphate cytidylyltransferase [Bacillus sp. (in: firmicutes)]
MLYDVIVLAAGMGKRMQAGKNKVFIELDSIPIIIRTLQVFDQDNDCRNIILPINPTDQLLFEQLFEQYSFAKPIRLVKGGQERQDSVRNGLQYVSDEDDHVVLIHDGARPFVTQSLIRELVQQAKVDGAAIPGVRVKDTVKRVEAGQVIETVERASLWAVHTPQAFRVSLIKQAHEWAVAEGFLGTDDASLVENMGERVFIVQDSYNNIKITTPEDLYIAEAIIKKLQ